MSFLKNIFGTKKSSKPVTLLEVESPSCPITAIVEQDDRVAFFYLWGPEKSNYGVKSCWIRNLAEAPETRDQRSLEMGQPPMQSKANCKFPMGQSPLQADDLDIKWFEEGDGAVLLEKGEVIAIIPSWSGMGGFFGYARDCIGQGDFAWHIVDSNDLLQRIEESEEFWTSWLNDINPFTIEQPKFIELYAELFGKHDQYFAIDNEEGAPIGLYVRTSELRTVFATVAMSVSPMPQVEMYAENRFDANRIELGMMLEGGLSKGLIQNIANWFNGSVDIPWENITFLGEGHTLHFDAFENPELQSVLITNKLSCLHKVEVGVYRNSNVQFLWMIPITNSELSFAKENGSSDLIVKLEGIGEEIYSLGRKSVV